MSGGGVARAGAERVKRRRKAGVELVDVEQHGAGSGELYGEWQPVEVAADLRDGGSVVVGQLEVSVVAAGALDEQCAGRGVCDGAGIGLRRELEWGDGVALLRLQSQGLAAGRDHGQRRSGG